MIQLPIVLGAVPWAVCHCWSQAPLMRHFIVYAWLVLIMPHLAKMEGPVLAVLIWDIVDRFTGFIQPEVWKYLPLGLKGPEVSLSIQTFFWKSVRIFEWKTFPQCAKHFEPIALSRVVHRTLHLSCYGRAHCSSDICSWPCTVQLAKGVVYFLPLCSVYISASLLPRGGADQKNRYGRYGWNLCVCFLSLAHPR